LFLMRRFVPARQAYIRVPSRGQHPSGADKIAGLL
jgi:hypothetical protein